MWRHSEKKARKISALFADYASQKTLLPPPPPPPLYPPDVQTYRSAHGGSNGQTYGQAREAMLRALRCWWLRSQQGWTYRRIGEDHHVSVERARQLCFKGQRIEKELAVTPRPPHLLMLWGPL